MEEDMSSKESRKRKGKSGDKKSTTCKKPKVDLQGEEGNKLNQKKVSAGHGCEVNRRHVKQLESLIALMSPKTFRLKSTNDKSEVLGRSIRRRLYMEWVKKEDRYILWGSKENLLIKFEFHGGFEETEMKLDVENPLLTFSDHFDRGDGWEDVKLLLKKLFGNSREKADENHDYMFAFTRSGEIVHFRIFKLHSKVTSDIGILRLEETPLSFILKPLEMSRSAEIGGESTKYVFLDKHRLMFQRKNNICLETHHVLLDGSCPSGFPHVLEHPLSPKVILPVSHINAQWLGFNTSCKEFFERYRVSKTEDVPGTGPMPPFAVGKIRTLTDPLEAPVPYQQITIPMKVFSRGLIVCVGETHKKGACFSEFNESNIFLQGGRVVILGVELVEYSEPQAMQNFNAVHTIISHRLDVPIPPDVMAVLEILQHSPIDQMDLMENNFAWMDPVKRSHMLDDLHEDLSELGANAQLGITQTLPEMATYLDKFAKNWLLTCIVLDKLSEKYTKNLEALKQHMESKALYLQKTAVDPRDKLQMNVGDTADAKESIDLWNGRRYVKGIRNSYVHLPATAREKANIELTKEEVDLVTSSEFAAACSYIQVQVPMAFKDIDEKRASYERFSAYFPSVENMEFNSEDHNEDQ